MCADPKDVGYDEMKVPGFEIQDLLGVGAFSVVMKANHTEEVPRIELPNTILPAEWTEHAVVGDGNCLFHAIAHQLQTAGFADEQGRAYTHELLRELALNHVDGDARFRLMMSDTEYMDLARLTGYVDHGAIAALATALGVNITIFGAPGGQQVDIDSEGIVGSVTPATPVLRVVYNGHNHYDSVVPSVLAEQISGRKRTRSQSQTGKPVKWVRMEDGNLPVAVKIFAEKHRHMRDFEEEVLRKLKMNNNVPSVIQSLDVCGRPAIIVSPAGDNVLPVRNGVRGNKTDFVKLVQVLQHAHGLGICHRDVKPQNMFKDKNERIILNDWSSAARSGELVPWAGTRFYYERQLGDHAPDPADDLVALVRSAYVMYTNEASPDDATLRAMDLSPLWHKALKHARNCRYGKLMAFLNKL